MPIQQISHDEFGNVFWAGNDLYVSASASQANGAAPVTIADLLAGYNASDTPALVGAKLLTIGVYNNDTAQTITGLSLASTGTTASGGAFSIPYPITQDVNGNPVSIASGSSQTFLVPLGNGVLRTWVLTPTFGAAPAAGSIDTVTTVQGAAGNGTIQKGSLPPWNAGAPVLIATIPYSQFTTASETTYVNVLAALHRQARERTWYIQNTMNQPLTSLTVGIFDSSLWNNPESSGYYSFNAPSTGAQSLATGTSLNRSNGNAGYLGAAGDSFQIGMGIGATLPTSGNILVYCIESGISSS